MNWVRIGLVFLIGLSGCGPTSRTVSSRASDGGAPPVSGSAGANDASDGGLPAVSGSAGTNGASDGGAPAVSGAAGADDSSADGVASMAAWRVRLAAAHCARDQRCGPLWPSVADCVTDADTWPAYVRFFAGIDQDSYLASTHTLAAASVLDACVAAITTTPCDDFRTSYAACLDVLVPKAPRASGAPCVHDSPFVLAPACAPGLVCSEPYDCGVCEPLAPAANEGESCSASQDCAPGLVCSAQVCRPYAELPQEGESCAGGGNCRAGVACSTDSWLCVRQGQEGDPCEVDANECLRNLTCVADGASGRATCRAHAARGEACPRGGSVGSASACNRSNWCVFDTPDAPTGTCDVAPLTPGPCPLFADDGGYYCPAGTYADAELTERSDLEPRCTCEPLLELGAPCQADLQCARGFCSGGPSGPRCVPLLPDGAVCAPNDRGHCASYRGCDLESGTCLPECD